MIGLPAVATAARLIVAAGLAALLPAAAAAETRIVPGGTLVLNDTLSSLVITTSHGLSGGMRISLDGDLSCLSVVAGGAVLINTASCPDDVGPLRIELPPATPVTLTASGDGSVHVADLAGPFVVTLNGSVDLQGGRVGSLVLTGRSSGDVAIGEIHDSAVLQMLGSGDVRLRAVRGTLSVQQHGSGDLDIGAIDSDTADIAGTGSGDMLIGAGRIATLRARMVGSGDLSVAATVGDADLSAAGGSDIKLGRVTGQLTRNASGGSDIVVGGPALITNVTGKLASAIANARDEGGDVTLGTPKRSMALHFLTIGVVAFALFTLWRLLSRRGGLQAVRRVLPSFGTQRPHATPTHPGVLALSETMTRLDQRLARVEGYVTSREFDLNRKFRDLGPG
jgi:hypothetical protein